MFFECRRCWTLSGIDRPIRTFATPPSTSRAHYLEHGAREGRNPHPLFDTKFLSSSKIRMSRKSGLNPLVALSSLWRERRADDPNPLFDTKFYLKGKSERRRDRRGEPACALHSLGCQRGLWILSRT